MACWSAKVKIHNVLSRSVMGLALRSRLIRDNRCASVALIRLRPFEKRIASVACVGPGIGELAETRLIKIHLLCCPFFQRLRLGPLHFINNLGFLLHSSSLWLVNPRLDGLVAVGLDERVVKFSGEPGLFTSEVIESFL